MPLRSIFALCYSFLLIVVAVSAQGAIGESIKVTNIRDYDISRGGEYVLEVQYVNRGASMYLYKKARDGYVRESFFSLKEFKRPVYLRVSDQGKIVALGGDYALAAFNSDGELIGDFGVQEVLSAKSYQELVASGRGRIEHWFCRECAAFDEFYFQSGLFYFKDHMGTEFKIDLGSGRLNSSRGQD